MADENINQELRDELAEQNAADESKEPELSIDDLRQEMVDAAAELEVGVPEVVDQAEAEIAARPDDEAAILAKLLTNRPDLKQYLQAGGKAAQKADNLGATGPEDEDGEPDNPEQAQRAQEQLRLFQQLERAKQQYNPEIVANLQREIAAVLSDDESDEAKAQAIREKLTAVGLPAEAAEQFLAKLSSGEIGVDQLGAAVEQLVANNPEIMIRMAGEVKDFRDLLERANQAQVDADDPELREMFGSMSEATEKLLDGLDVPGFINLFFATGYSSGSYGSRYEHWGEEKEDVNEKKTLGVLKRVFDSEEGYKLFLAKLTQLPPGAKLEDQDLAAGLEKFLNEFQSGSTEAKAESKKRFSEAVEKAGEAKDILGINLDKEKVNLSPDVIKFLVLATQKRVEKK